MILGWSSPYECNICFCHVGVELVVVFVVAVAIAVTIEEAAKIEAYKSRERLGRAIKGLRKNE